MAWQAAVVMAMRIMRRALTAPGPWASSVGPAPVPPRRMRTPLPTSDGRPPEAV